MYGIMDAPIREIRTSSQDVECPTCGKDIELEGIWEASDGDGDWIPLDRQLGAKHCDRCDKWTHDECLTEYLCCHACADELLAATKPPVRRVSFNKHLGLWQARFKMPDGRIRFLGSFASEEYANKAYDRKAQA